MSTHHISRCDVCQRELTSAERAGELSMILRVNGQDYDLGQATGDRFWLDLCSPGCALLRCWALIERAYGRPVMDARHADAAREAMA